MGRGGLHFTASVLSFFLSPHQGRIEPLSFHYFPGLHLQVIICHRKELSPGLSRIVRIINWRLILFYLGGSQKQKANMLLIWDCLLSIDNIGIAERARGRENTSQGRTVRKMKSATLEWKIALEWRDIKIHVCVWDRKLGSGHITRYVSGSRSHKEYHNSFGMAVLPSKIPIG